ncbi:MAG TPA: recombinase family protein [Candidatus Acidoferrum sp.]|nr:recombinase family protein [Candidatus Acidoferrum sp.]
MTVSLPIPAAQYLRMSTEHQQYSTENQEHCNAQYAQSHGFTITRTYRDSAKSGLWLKGRPGLRELLRDVTDGKTDYKAILVYDVSRWGRFQDTDEAAHYEFLCKSAGIPIHYCAETFSNDGSLPSSIMKALKRVMAGEYSRELGVKVIAGQMRLARLGFKQGGIPGYGLRRLLVSESRTPKQLLAHGEMKSISTDRVILVPGPACEIEEVREIFRKFTVDRMSLKAIARDLNNRGVPSIQNKRWTHSVVASLISHPKYVGCNVFNRTTMRLGAVPGAVPTADWVICPGTHEQIVDNQTFALAQEIRASRTIRKTNEQLLQDLRSLLAVKGKLSNRIIDNSVGMPSSRTFWYRFGGLRRACEQIGYDWRKNGRKSDEQMLQHLRSLLASKGRLSKPIIDATPRLVSSHQLRRRFGRVDRAYELIGYNWRKDLSKARQKT